MATRRRTDLPTAALVMELGKTEGRSTRDVSKLTGVRRTTVENILNGAHGWDQVAQSDAFKWHRQEQNRALEQANRTMAAEALKKAWGKMDKASFYQLVTGAAIMTDKARLLAGEPTENLAHLHLHDFDALESLRDKLNQLKQPPAGITAEPEIERKR